MFILFSPFFIWWIEPFKVDRSKTLFSGRGYSATCLFRYLTYSLWKVQSFILLGKVSLLEVYVQSFPDQTIKGMKRDFLEQNNLRASTVTTVDSSSLTGLATVCADLPILAYWPAFADENKVSSSIRIFCYIVPSSRSGSSEFHRILSTYSFLSCHYSSIYYWLPSLAITNVYWL